MFFQLFSLFLIFTINIRSEVLSAKPCLERRIAGADSVCVCNQTYCDDFPALKPPKKGYALVYQSSKSGLRFKETTLKLDPNSKPLNATQTQTISIDSNQKYQKIIGFGGAFTDETVFVLNALPKSMSDYIMESYFGENGIKYNMGRVPVASTDYSLRVYTYDDYNDDKNLSHFALAKEDLELKIPYIKKAQNLSMNSMKLFGSPWIAPKWVKTERKTNRLKGEIGGEYYQIWANYMIKFLDAYKSHNISLWGLTTQNEPTLGMIFQDNSIYYDSIMMREYIRKNLGPLLHKSGYTSDKLKLMIFDDNVWKQDSKLQNWTQTILGDKESKKYVSGIAYHWYESSKTDGYPDTVLDSVHEKYPDSFMLMTEACHLKGLGNGRWDFGEHYAHDIIRDLNHWTSGWVEWNMVLGLNGCTRCSALQCGASVLVDVLRKEVYKQPTFYTIGHFSKFLSENSVRIAHKLEKNIKNLFVLTMKRPDNTTVVVVLNQSDNSYDLRINELNNHLTHRIESHSIHTYVLNV